MGGPTRGCSKANKWERTTSALPALPYRRWGSSRFAVGLVDLPSEACPEVWRQPKLEYWLQTALETPWLVHSRAGLIYRIGR